jgi:hypothetical protein
VTILDTLADEALFAGSFPVSTWSAWFAFLSALYGLPLDGRRSRDVSPPHGALSGS